MIIYNMRIYGTVITQVRHKDRGFAQGNQDSEESIGSLAERHDLNPKTVQKWKRRRFTHDVPMCPKLLHSTVLTTQEETIVMRFSR